eukprot:14067447-Heterocapsa_arctica.AAC.1
MRSGTIVILIVDWLANEARSQLAHNVLYEFRTWEWEIQRACDHNGDSYLPWCPECRRARAVEHPVQRGLIINDPKFDDD